MNDKTLLFLLVMSFAASASGDEYRSKINEGYEYYKNGEYDKASEDYRQAGVIKPDKALPNFGKGAALYRSNDFEGASKEYGAAIDKDDDRIKADAHYNIGNAFYRAEKYGEAVKSYINALKINPDDKDYKHNLEMALLKQQLQQQQQQQQQNQDESRDQKEQKQQDKSEKDQKKQDQEQQQQKQEDQKQDDSEKKQQQQQQQSVDEQQMNEEDAKNLLSRFEEDEKEIQKRLKQIDIGRSSGHDW
jgi:Ca-activated chloride channel family protein